jgi:hypothetical protein
MSRLARARARLRVLFSASLKEFDRQGARTRNEKLRRRPAQRLRISWKSYDEDSSGKLCPLTDAGPRDANGDPLYGVRHDHFVYFDDVTGSRNAKSSYCIAHIRPFTELQHDLASNHVARYNFIPPNVCDDMHDACGDDPIAHGDAWLRRNVPHILNSTAFRSGGAVYHLG